MTAAPDRTLTAAVAILIYALLIGFTDNFVRIIAVEAGLWQFHAVRAVMALILLKLAALAVGLDLRPARVGPVVARSVIHASAMLIYFGCLAFLPVAQVAAGLFTAPIFVLLFSKFIYGQRIGPVRIVAVACGFAGVLMLLGTEALEGATLAAVLPVFAGALYAFGNIATREWCGGGHGDSGTDRARCACGDGRFRAARRGLASGGVLSVDFRAGGRVAAGGRSDDKGLSHRLGKPCFHL